MVIVLVLSLVILPTTIFGQNLPTLPSDSQNQKVSFSKAKDGEKLVVFTKDRIRRCTKITEEMVELKAISSRLLPKQPVAQILDQVIGKYTKFDLVHGEPVLLRRICSKDELPYISFKLRDKKNRGVTIATKAKTSPKCDSLVDVKFIPNNKDKNAKTRVLATKLRVMTSQAAGVGNYFVTLETSPKISMEILLVWKSGEFELLPSSIKGGN